MSKAANAEVDHTITICGEEELAYGRCKQNTQRERHKEKSLIKNATVTNDNQPTFTKGYKVTLYSD